MAFLLLWHCVHSFDSYILCCLCYVSVPVLDIHGFVSCIPCIFSVHAAYCQSVVAAVSVLLRKALPEPGIERHQAIFLA